MRSWKPASSRTAKGASRAPPARGAPPAPAPPAVVPRDALLEARQQPDREGGLPRLVPVGERVPARGVQLQAHHRRTASEDVQADRRRDIEDMADPQERD